MMAQVVAAALVSECKALAHPASVDSIPTSADKEDHVSMSPIAARKLAAIVENLEQVLAIELITAFQAMEFLRPLRSSAAIESVRRALRRVVPAWRKDRLMTADLAASRDFLRSNAMEKAAAQLE
jgi:histidine ammonia-lyase